MGTRTSSDLIHFKNIGDIWYEVWRNWASLPDPVLWKTFAAGDTTPSVAWPGLNYQANNSSGTMITNFDDGIDGQQLIVKLDVNTGIAHHADSIRLKNSASITIGEVDANFLIGFVRNAGIWFEMFRSRNVPQAPGLTSAAFVQGSGNAVNDASTFDGYTLAQVVKALRNLGLLQ